MNLNQYKTIILDCDGVIFDSNSLKLNAFREALSEFDKSVVDNFIEYFQNNFGTSRYNLTKVFITEFLNIKFDENIYNRILNKYGENCKYLYKEAMYTKSLLVFLDKYKNKKMYIASGSDQEELREVFISRNLNGYFIDIFGSPVKKSVLVNNIMSINENAVMIGDAKSDMNAAKDNGIDFIFMSKYSTNKEMKQDKNLLSINNLEDLL